MPSLLRKLPPELQLSIIDFLPEVDKACLRLASKYYQSLVKRNQELLMARSFCPTSPAYLNPEYLEFLKRLLKPGDIFSGTEVKICGCCPVIWPASMFSNPEMLIDGYEFCRKCISRILRTHMGFWTIHNFDGKNYKKCGNCWGEYTLEEIHFGKEHLQQLQIVGGLYLHDASPELLEMTTICEKCHVAICNNASCADWPRDGNGDIVARLQEAIWANRVAP